MTEEQIKEVIKDLRDDEKYYGDYGRRFVSNSDIGILLNNPLQYGKPKAKTGAMLIGTYIHDFLQGRAQSIKVSEANSRNSKIYKDEVKASGDMLLLQREIDNITPVLEQIVKNTEFMSYILGGVKAGQIEQPAVGEIFGVWFKAKADRLNTSAGFVVDIKTTSDINKFKSSFYKYGYDTQAYIYEVLFKLPMLFAVLDKGTGQLGLYTVSRDTLINAEDKVKRALEIRDLYYVKKSKDITKHILKDEL